jgi:hypothetical protein
MEELNAQQKLWIANHLEYYKGTWFSEYTKGLLTGLAVGLFAVLAMWLC